MKDLKKAYELVKSGKEDSIALKAGVYLENGKSILEAIENFKRIHQYEEYDFTWDEIDFDTEGVYLVTDESCDEVISFEDLEEMIG